MTSLFLVPTEPAQAFELWPTTETRSRRQQKPLFQRSLVMIGVVAIQATLGAIIFYAAPSTESVETLKPIMVKTVDEQKPPAEQIVPPQPIIVNIPPPKLTPPPVIQIAETVQNNAITLQTSPPPPSAPPAEAAASDFSEAEISYHGKLLARLAKFKTYPRAAKLAKIQGVTEVAFTINQSGELLHSEIVKSSGQSVLDQAALETLQKASPFPPIPAELGTTKLTLTVPIEYEVKSAR